MSKLEKLKAATDIYGVAELLGFRPKMLAYLLYVIGPNAKYTVFEIPKRSGGTRAIAAPIPQMKLLQSRLAELLQDSVDEISNIKGLHDRASHGFTRKRSIFSNAKVHRRRRWVFNVDIENFFGSINFGRVRGFFIKSNDFGLQPAVATVLAQIACHSNSLPQGSPCSPAVSNLIGRILDIRLIKLASANSCSYSRYADDLTFSTNKREFPTSIAVAGDPAHAWSAGNSLSKILFETGFALNSSKTRMQYRTSRQEVTGLVVNAKVNIRAEYGRRVRAMVHRLINTGGFDYATYSNDSNGRSVVTHILGDVEQLHGMLGFIDATNLLNKNPSNTGAGHDARLSSKEEVYRQFLLYKEFYAAKAPVILCEGKTDGVYLRHAVRQLAPLFPQLVDIKDPIKPTLKIHFHKYGRSSTSRLLGLGGGTPHLKKWMVLYDKAMKKFKAPGKENPVIVVVDNDAGANEIINYAKAINKQISSTSLSYIHLRGNLYLVTIPLPPNKTSVEIEDCFDLATLSLPLDGKTLSLSDPIDEKIHFSKHVFAQKVVTPNASSINFNGFAPLLTMISTVIADHQAFATSQT